MRIAIDLTGGPGSLTTNESEYIKSTFDQLAVSHPEPEWILVPPLKSNSFSWMFPLSSRKAKQLEAIQPRVLITTDPPQKKPENLAVIWFCSHEQTNLQNIEAVAARADRIVVTSDISSLQLLKKNVPSGKINVIYGAPAGADLWLDWHQKYSVKQQNSEGKEFFLARTKIGGKTGWEGLFKAFSIFKRWQQTEVQLLVSAEMDEDYEKEFDDKLESYKYRQDVKLLDNDKKITDILSAAYGVIIHKKDLTGIDMLNSFKAGVPVITSNDNIFHESVSGCFLPASNDADEIGRQIINLYRDEHLRDTLAEKGKNVSGSFTWEATTQSWYDLIAKFAG